jgi:hypothetical protein
MNKEGKIAEAFAAKTELGSAAVPISDRMASMAL